MKAIQKFSLLGVVLMGASSLIAAIFPSVKKTTDKPLKNGRLVFSANNTVGRIAGDRLYQQTCKPAAFVRTCIDTDSVGGISGNTDGDMATSNFTTTG